MVSKKAKKQDQNINSRLQLVVKSGKYCLGYQSTLKSLRQVFVNLFFLFFWKNSFRENRSLSSLQTTAHQWGSLRSSTMPCSQKPAFTTTQGVCKNEMLFFLQWPLCFQTTLIWGLHAVSSSPQVCWALSMQVILTSSEPCLSEQTGPELWFRHVFPCWSDGPKKFLVLDGLSFASESGNGKPLK